MSDAEFARLIADVIETTRHFEAIDARNKGPSSVAGVKTVQERKVRRPR